MTCALCYIDDCLPDEMTACKAVAGDLEIAQKMARAIVDGTMSADCAPALLKEPNEHIICGECARAHTEAQLEAGFELVACTATDCEQEFGDEYVRRQVTTNTYEMFKRRKEQVTFIFYDHAQKKVRLQKCLRDSGLELTYCPFCDFALVLEDANAKELACLNEECLKTSCM